MPRPTSCASAARNITRVEFDLNCSPPCGSGFSQTGRDYWYGQVRRSPEDEGCIRSAEAERIGHRIFERRFKSSAPYQLETTRLVYLAHVRRRWSDLVSQRKNGNRRLPLPRPDPQVGWMWRGHSDIGSPGERAQHPPTPVPSHGELLDHPVPRQNVVRAGKESNSLLRTFK